MTLQCVLLNSHWLSEHFQLWILNAALDRGRSMACQLSVVNTCPFHVNLSGKAISYV